MTVKQLNKSLTYWQDLLSLSHWDISVEYVGSWKINGDCTARSYIDEFHMKAKIEIIDPRFNDKESPYYETTEHLLLHELLHVRLFPDGVKEGTAQNTALEQGINALAKLLLELVEK